MVLFPVLILGDQWHTDPDRRPAPRRRPDRRPAGARRAVAVGALAYVFRRWPILMPLAIVFALPFRVPLHAGGDTANLLVPLYLVIAGGVVATRDWRDWAVAAGTATGAVPRRRPPAGRAARLAARPGRGRRPLRAADALLGRLLEGAAERLLLLRPVHRRLRGCCARSSGTGGCCAGRLVVVGGRGGRLRPRRRRSSTLTRSLFWNDQVIRSNEFHTYFRVNSVFWDPNVYGRYLALVIVVGDGGDALGAGRGATSGCSPA